MSKRARIFHDAYLAHDSADNFLAEALADRMRGAGLSVTSVHLGGAGTFSLESDAFRQEMFASFSFVVLLTKGFVESGVPAFYLGVAQVTTAPVFVLNAGVPEAEIPGYLHAPRYVTAALWDGLPEVVERIAEAAKPLPAAQAAALERVAAEFGLSPDELIRSSDDRSAFARRFAAECGVRLPEFRLVRELIRLRQSRKPPARKRAAVQ